MGRRAETVPSQRTAAALRRPDAALLSVGALARASGVPVATLRTWARRYGFPSSEARSSGQRAFPLAHVERLRLIRHALTLGHRAAQVLPASPAELRRLVALSSTEPPDDLANVTPPGADEVLLASAAQLDGKRLTRLLLDEWARLSPIEFLAARVAPLLASVGERWRRGELGIHHEHFLTARLADLLGALRQPFERDNGGALVVLATLPGERHTLGLSMAALALAHAGLRTLFLGAECPVTEIGKAVRERQACAAGISVSRASRSHRSVRLQRELRSVLPRNVVLLLGGDGASPLPGAERVDTLHALARWARQRLGLGD